MRGAGASRSRRAEDENALSVDTLGKSRHNGPRLSPLRSRRLRGIEAQAASPQTLINLRTLLFSTSSNIREQIENGSRNDQNEKGKDGKKGGIKNLDRKKMIQNFSLRNETTRFLPRHFR